jgi:selenide,water dikinase
MKQDIVDEETEAMAIGVMSQLNRDASRLMMKHGAHSATDITGFGLLGHGSSMARASGVTFVLRHQQVPVIKGVYQVLEKGAYPGGSSANRAFVEPRIQWDEGVPENVRKVMCDAQTSGGLLIAIEAGKAESLAGELLSAGYPQASVIGEVIPAGPQSVIIE